MGRINKLLYIAGPYSIGCIEENIKRAEQVSINLIKSGFHVITPHKNTSGYEKYEDGTLTYETWIEMDMDILSRCDAVYLMTGSENSNGVKKEVEFAHAGLKERKKPDQCNFERFNAVEYLSKCVGG